MTKTVRKFGRRNRNSYPRARLGLITSGTPGPALVLYGPVVI